MLLVIPIVLLVIPIVLLLDVAPELLFYNFYMGPVTVQNLRPLRLRVILFAKAPVPGRVKTRLAAAVGMTQAAALHRAFVADMIEKLMPLGLLELHTDIKTDEWSGFQVTRRLQARGDLGQRMYLALSGVSSLPAILIGGDAPTLPAGHLENLISSKADIALGPAEDGGYYAIFCRNINPRMFDGVEWSTGRTLEQTVRAVTSQGLSVELGPMWWDVDEPEDLDRLKADPHLPRFTREVLCP